MKGKGAQIMTPWEVEMNFLGSVVLKAMEDSPLTRHAALMAVAITMLAQCRAHGIDEDKLWAEMKKASPEVIGVTH